jgi:hypothetical protein
MDIWTKGSNIMPPILIAFIVAVLLTGEVFSMNAGNSTSGGSYGCDYSTLLSVDIHKCIAQYAKFVVPRGFRSNGQVDSNVCANLNNAMAAGIAIRDVYFFPCPTCSSSAASQVSTMVNYIRSNCGSAWSGRMWLDIEGTEYWTNSYSTNQQWYKSLVDATVSQNIVTGVYTSKYQWGSIFGSYDWSYNPANYWVWYAHYDNNPSYSDWAAFGGWTVPNAKQWLGDQSFCGANIDYDWTDIDL